jgi:hypothetical protein
LTIDPLANPVQNMKNLRAKARHELDAASKVAAEVMLKEWVRDKATITEGCMGVDKTVEYRKFDKDALDPDFRDI